MVSILFENPKNDNNVSAIARTAEFYGVEYYISRESKLNNKQSSGVIKHKQPKILNINDWKGRIIVTDSSFETNPKQFVFKDDDLIVFGNENTGVSTDAIKLSFAKIGIKSNGIVPCLNVAASVASILGIIKG